MKQQSLRSMLKPAPAGSRSSVAAAGGVLPACGERISSSRWFAHLFGFKESGSMQSIRDLLEFRENGDLVSRVNGARYGAGRFSTPSLGELRADLAKNGTATKLHGTGGLEIEHIPTGDVFEMHSLDEYAGATFMAASQFNCLEFPGPSTTPEQGVTGYAYDPTQGPACALAAPAATVVRNYFAPVRGQTGQSASNQLNNLEEVLGQVEHGDQLVRVHNGYTSSSDERLRTLNARLEQLPGESLLAALRIGLHSNVEVPWAAERYVLEPEEHRQRVTQVFCSALSCGYSDGSDMLWEPLARIVLDASYEATLLAAAIEAIDGVGTGQVLLTFIGGGVFRNRAEWIEDAIARACARLAHLRLRVMVCHYRRVDEGAASRIERAFSALREA